MYMMNNAVPSSCNSIREARDDFFLSFITFYAQTIHQFLPACDVSFLRFRFEESDARVVYYNSTNKMKISWFAIWITLFNLHSQDRIRLSYHLLQAIFSCLYFLFCIGKYSSVDSGNAYNFTGRMFSTHKVKFIFNKIFCDVTLCQWASSSRHLEEPQRLRNFENYLTEQLNIQWC